MGKFLRHVLLHNFSLKLLSVVLALGLWFVLKNDPVEEVAVEVPIVFRNVPDNLGMTYERIPRAQILLRGPRRVVRHLQSTDVAAEIDLTDGQPGERTFPASVVQVHRPNGLDVLNVGPDKFHITFMTLSKSSTNLNPATHE
jgi:hypothetical protein